MLVGKAINAAQTLRNAVKDVKEGIKSAAHTVDQVIKFGQAVYSKTADFIKKKVEEGKEKKAAEEKQKREDWKKEKKRKKNEGGTQD